MGKINYQTLREATEKAGKDKWQAKKINGEFFVIRHGSYTRQYGYTTYQPIAEIDNKPVRDFVALANPATVTALLDELEAKDKRITELEARTVTVKLPKKNIGWGRDGDDCWNNAIDACAEALASAGIGVKGE